MNDISTIEAGQHVKETYMPYAMSTIIDRALPDVRDGFKPVHRRILSSSYMAGITYNKDRSKTGELVTETMKVHHHGNVSIEEAIALMTEQNESLLHPYFDGEGAFGKVYSKDSPSPPRYTYCRLNKFSEEFFIDYKKDILTMVGEDKHHLQPVTLSSSFPNILIKNTSGIACGESCDFPSFNFQEICDASMAYIKDKNINLMDYISAPDFSSRGYLIYDKRELERIYNTGKGSLVLRAKYKYDKENNCIDISEIPYTTTADAIIAKIAELIKKDKIPVFKSITDVRDETGFNEETQKEELKITIDVKKNTNVESLINMLLKKTPLESTYSANMNCLVNYEPKVLGIKAILDEWLAFRRECIIKSTNKDLDTKNTKLRYLKALEKISKNTQKAIQIIQFAEEELISKDLSDYFKIDLDLAETISNMKLRNINNIYLNKQTIIIPTLESEINELNDILNSESKINDIIIADLERVKKTYSKPRMTEIIYEDTVQDITKEDLVEDNLVTICLSSEGYIKRNLKYSEAQKLKDNDEILQLHQTNNRSDLLLFTNQGRVYTRKTYEIAEKLPSVIGEYLPNILDLLPDERVIYICTTNNYKGDIVSVFKNGKVSKTSLSSFKTKTNRQVSQQAYNTDSELVDICLCEKDEDILFISKECKGLLTNLKNFNSKNSRNTAGDIGMKIAQVEGNKIVFAKINPKENLSFIIKTQKGKSKELYLNDIAENSQVEKSWYDYLKSQSRGVQGNFIINTRTNNDKVTQVIVNK